MSKRLIHPVTGSRMLAQGQQRAGATDEPCCCPGCPPVPCAYIGPHPCLACGTPGPFEPQLNRCTPAVLRFDYSGVTGICRDHPYLSLLGIFNSGIPLCAAYVGLRGNICTWEQYYFGLNEASSPFVIRIFDSPGCSGPSSLGTQVVIGVKHEVYTGYDGLIRLRHTVYDMITTGWVVIDSSRFNCSQPMSLQLNPQSEVQFEQTPFQGGTVTITPCGVCPIGCNQCFAIGSRGAIRSGCSGVLRLFINDDFYADNTGSFSGTVQVNQDEPVTIEVVGNHTENYGPQVNAGDTISWNFTGAVDICHDCFGPGTGSLHDPDGNLIGGNPVTPVGTTTCASLQPYMLTGLIEAPL